MYRSQAGKMAGGSGFSSLGARFVLHGEGILRVVDGQRVLSYRLARPGPKAGVHHMARALVAGGTRQVAGGLDRGPFWMESASSKRKDRLKLNDEASRSRRRAVPRAE